MGKLLFVPMLTYGHFNLCINIGRLLVEQHPEHEIYFLVSDVWEEKLKKWEPKFKSLVYISDNETWKKSIESHQKEWEEKGIKKMVENVESKKNDSLINLMNEFGDEWKKPTIERLNHFNQFLINQVETIYEKREKIEKLVNDLNPDVVCFDTIIMIPFLLERPFVQIMTMNPLFMDHISLPPYGSGYSSNKSIAHNDWKLYRKTRLEATKEYYHFINIKLCEEGQTCVRPCNCITESPYFNVYIYPKEIDYYSDKISLPGKWFRMDNNFLPTKKIELFDQKDREGRFKRLKELYDIPDGWLEPDTKLIFFSLGSMASSYRYIIMRLMNLIANVPKYKFIVSKGLLDEEYSLPSNCVGKGWVDQFETLKVVDLMIGHGGNNSLCECFSMGVKLVLMPLYSDQPDNARRLIDTNHGYVLNPFTCTQDELNKTLDDAINDDELLQKVQKISKRILKDNGMNMVVNEFHKLITNNY